jgi:hypothetical protein
MLSKDSVALSKGFAEQGSRQRILGKSPHGNEVFAKSPILGARQRLYQEPGPTLGKKIAVNGQLQLTAKNSLSGGLSAKIFNFFSKNLC